MNVTIDTSFTALVRSVSTEMTNHGFKPRGQAEFIRTLNRLVQRFALSVRQSPVEKTAFVEAFVGFNFPDVEELAASLQGKKPRPGFMTCSLNIGLLTPESKITDWPLPSDEDVGTLATIVLKMVSEFAVLFWDEFSTLEKLATHYGDGDVLLCRGAEWPWRCAATYALLGEPTRAVSFLRERLKQAAGMSAEVVGSAIEKLSQQKGN